MNNFTDFHCGQSFHTFVRYGEDVEAIHVDGSICKAAEFNIAQLLDDELPTLHRCPGCDRLTLNDDDHIRDCIGYKTPLPIEDVMDAYSDPTDHAKREAMLREIER